jgi:hypothetical protein
MVALKQQNRNNKLLNVYDKFWIPVALYTALHTRKHQPDGGKLLCITKYIDLEYSNTLLTFQKVMHTYKSEEG